MTTKIVWWHFSDLHWDLNTSTERSAFLLVLFNHLRLRLAEFGPPAFIAFTGDIANTGDACQYAAAEKGFFTALRELVGASCRFFVVPGNHDMRRAIAKTGNALLVTTIKSPELLDKFLDDEDCVQMVERPFAAYQAFQDGMCPDVTRDTLGWRTTLDVGSKRFSLTGLNSAWASSYHRTADDGVADERRLLLGQRQLLALSEPRDGSIRIVLLHHPLDWLTGYCSNQLRQALLRHADFVLCGHTHALDDLAHTLGAAGSTVFLPAPAIYDRANTDTIKYARGYNIVQFDPDSRRGAAHYFRYTGGYVRKFEPFTDLFEHEGQKEFVFDLSPRQTVSAATPSHFEKFHEMLLALPKLARLNTFLETSLDALSLERHTVRCFETLMIGLMKNADFIDQHSIPSFWESAVLSRNLIYCDQLIRAKGHRSYCRADAVELLCSQLSKLVARDPAALQLKVEEYRRLFALSLDSCSFTAEPLQSIPDVYRRCFILPWAIGTALFCLDYPEVIPRALRSEGRIADVFLRNLPESLSITSCGYDAKDGDLTVGLSIRDRDGFLAVTMLKHYFDLMLQQAVDFWRHSQRVLPPITLHLAFPLWLNKQVGAYELTLETSKIIRLLMGRAIYRDAQHVWLRELIQNALDAIVARRALDGESYTSLLEIELRDATHCVIRDNGIGMSQQHILTYLTRLGRSIWSTNELHDGSADSARTPLSTIGRFGIGFATVFHDSEWVALRTRFFRATEECGWMAEFQAIDKPFLLEPADIAIGTQFDIHLPTDGLPAESFLELMRSYFVYLDENVRITPDPGIPRNLAEVTLLDAQQRSNLLHRDVTTTEQVGPYPFTLRCIFGFGAIGNPDIAQPPPNCLVVSNSGVRIFEQSSLILKTTQPAPSHSEMLRLGTHYHHNEHTIERFWILLDFNKESSPVLPSRVELEIGHELILRIRDIIEQRFCEALQFVTSELAAAHSNPVVRSNAVLDAILESLTNATRYSRRYQTGTFCDCSMIETTAIAVYSRHCRVTLQSDDGSTRSVAVNALNKLPAGHFVIAAVNRSPLFKVYARSTDLKQWAVVANDREYALLEKIVRPLSWRGFWRESGMYSELSRRFTEVRDCPLNKYLRGDCGAVEDSIFDGEALIVLPANLGNSRRRADAATTTRHAVIGHWPIRVLLNPTSPLYVRLVAFVLEATHAGNSDALDRLKLLLDSLFDGVIDNDRLSMARKRWEQIQQNLRALLGDLPEVPYEKLLVRRA